MSRVSPELRRVITQRARSRCEYCGLAQDGQEATFHIDHVKPMASGGQTVAENLELACVSCSLRKAARRAAVDPVTGKLAPLFDPRRDAWQSHFRWQGVLLLGMTPTGRATVSALDMNRPLMVAIRREEPGSSFPS